MAEGKRDLYDVIRDRQDELRGYPETRTDRLHYWWSSVRLDDIFFWVWSAMAMVYGALALASLIFIVTMTNA